MVLNIQVHPPTVYGCLGQKKIFFFHTPAVIIAKLLNTFSIISVTASNTVGVNDLKQKQ